MNLVVLTPTPYTHARMSWLANHTHKKESKFYYSALKWTWLTSLLSADGDIGHLSCRFSYSWNSIQSLNLERVVGMCHKVLDHHGSACEAHGSWHEAHIAVAWLAGLPFSPTTKTRNIIGYILPTTGVTGRRPLQKESGFVDVKGQVSRRRGRSYFVTKNIKNEIKNAYSGKIWINELIQKC